MPTYSEDGYQASLSYDYATSSQSHLVTAASGGRIAAVQLSDEQARRLRDDLTVNLPEQRPTNKLYIGAVFCQAGLTGVGEFMVGYTCTVPGVHRKLGTPSTPAAAVHTTNDRPGWRGKAMCRACADAHGITMPEPLLLKDLPVGTVYVYSGADPDNADLWRKVVNQTPTRTQVMNIEGHLYGLGASVRTWEVIPFTPPEPTRLRDLKAGDVFYFTGDDRGGPMTETVRIDSLKPGDTFRIGIGIDPLRRVVHTLSNGLIVNDYPEGSPYGFETHWWCPDHLVVPVSVAPSPSKEPDLVHTFKTTAEDAYGHEDPRVRMRANVGPSFDWRDNATVLLPTEDIQPGDRVQVGVKVTKLGPPKLYLRDLKVGDCFRFEDDRTDENARQLMSRGVLISIRYLYPYGRKSEPIEFSAGWRAGDPVVVVPAPEYWESVCAGDMRPGDTVKENGRYQGSEFIVETVCFKPDFRGDPKVHIHGDRDGYTHFVRNPYEGFERKL